MRSRRRFKFRLYVAGDTQNSAQALANLTALCRKHLPDDYELEIVDVFRDPNRALTDGICMTPTLLKITPLPVRKIIGVLNQQEVVLRSLGLEPLTE
jgi:circadian clock protein KaiB